MIITIEKREILACCGKKQIFLKINRSITEKDLVSFVQGGFPFLQQYRDSGIMYVEDKGLIASCNFGNNEIRIKCKNNYCQDSIDKLQKIILSL